MLVPRVFRSHIERYQNIIFKIWTPKPGFSSVQFNCSVVSDSLRSHGLQHTRPPWQYQLLEFIQTYVHWVGDTIQLMLWCPLLLLQSIFPSIRVFSNESALRGQSIGVSASTSVLSMNTQDWSPLGWTGWISLQSKGLSRVFSNTTVQKHQFFGAQLSSQSNSMCVLSDFSRVWPFVTPMDCSLLGFSVHEILQARILEWVAIPSSRGSSPSWDSTHVSCASCVGS